MLYDFFSPMELYHSITIQMSLHGFRNFFALSEPQKTIIFRRFAHRIREVSFPYHQKNFCLIDHIRIDSYHEFKNMYQKIAKPTQISPKKSLMGFSMSFSQQGQRRYTTSLPEKASTELSDKILSSKNNIVMVSQVSKEINKAFVDFKVTKSKKSDGKNLYHYYIQDIGLKSQLKLENPAFTPKQILALQTQNWRKMTDKEEFEFRDSKGLTEMFPFLTPRSLRRKTISKTKSNNDVDFKSKGYFTNNNSKKLYSFDTNTQKPRRRTLYHHLYLPEQFKILKDIYANHTFSFIQRKIIFNWHRMSLEERKQYRDARGYTDTDFKVNRPRVRLDSSRMLVV